MTFSAFPPEYFARQDETNDGLFYTMPRLVVHIDDHAINAVRALFTELMPSEAIVLDLMSSWRSHLPDSLKPSRVIGLGMNAQEMAANPQLNRSVVHDLNANPALPFEDAAFDAVVCTVSVQYMTQPIEVFAQVNRVLKPGGVFVVTFSNRCFPNKAVAVWLSTGDRQHVALVTQYFELSGSWRGISSSFRLSQKPGENDPLFAVWAYRQE